MFAIEDHNLLFGTILLQGRVDVFLPSGFLERGNHLERYPSVNDEDSVLASLLSSVNYTLVT